MARARNAHQPFLDKHDLSHCSAIESPSSLSTLSIPHALSSVRQREIACGMRRVNGDFSADRRHFLPRLVCVVHSVRPPSSFALIRRFLLPSESPWIPIFACSYPLHCFPLYPPIQWFPFLNVYILILPIHCFALSSSSPNYSYQLVFLYMYGDFSTRLFPSLPVTVFILL